MASNSSTYQYLNHDWETQLTMLKVIYDTETIYVKYIDDENEEIGLINQEDYNTALRFAANHTNNFLKLILRDSKGNMIAKPGFKIDTDDREIKQILNPTVALPNSNSTTAQNNEQVFQNDILANLPNEKQNWLVSYLEQLKKDIVKDMETKIKDLVLTQSTVILTNNNSNNNNINENENASAKLTKSNTDNDLLVLSNRLNFEERIAKLLLLLSEAKLSERPIKIAFLEEELQLSGALNAVFVKDMTMPDGTKCLPGMKFQKKWLIKNTGKLPWSSDTFPIKLVSIAGNITTQNEFVNVESTDVDNTTIISVDLVAPNYSGEFFSEWVLVCHNFQFGPRIWASIEVIEINENHNQNDLSIFRNVNLSQTDDLDEEFVVVPDCFDLNKNWKSKTSSKNIPSNSQEQNDTLLDTSYLDVFSEKSPDSIKHSLPENSQMSDVQTSLSLANIQNEPEEEKSNDLKTFSSSLKEVLSSQPINIAVEHNNTAQKQSVEMKSPSSFPNSAFNLVKDALAISNNALSNVQMPSYIGDITINKPTLPEIKELKPQLPDVKPSPVSTITSVSKSIGDAFGSLGSVYQSGKITETNMDKLITMGFANRAQNIHLLKKFDNDLDKVIAFLCEQQETNYR